MRPPHVSDLTLTHTKLKKKRPQNSYSGLTRSFLRGKNLKLSE